MKQDIESSWRELSSYLDEMLELEGEARERWLQALEVSEPKIGRLLRSQLSQLVALDAADFLGAADVNPYASLGGQRFGAYTLERQLGQGGMGSVWLAHRSDGRFTGQAAVKLLSPMLVGHPTERRFVREGSVLARLRHPNIARLLDAGVEGGHQPYLVLEYVPGEHIDRHCDRRLLDVSARIRLFLNVLDAVAHAHSNLIVHRDLKPSNILVTEEGVVKLLDFGVAALLSPLEECLTQLAQAGHTLGYAAPEQIRGETVTTATDVYSLGVVLFLLLTGQHPHLPECKNAPELMKAILEGEPHLPSEVAADPRLARELRGDLDNIVRKALSRDRADRYATVTQFAEDLRRYLALEPVSARPRSIGYLATMFVRRHRASVALAVGIVAVLICAVAVTTTEMLEARKQRAEAARQRDQARFETRHAEASHDFLQLLMTADLGTKKPLSTFHDRLEYGVSLLDTQYRQDPKFAGRMLVQLATFYRDNEETSRANELYEKAYQLGRANHDPSLMASAQCYRAFGDAYADNRAGLVERLDEAQRLVAQLHDPDVDLEVACLQARARMEIQRGRREVAEPLLRQALHIMEEDGGTYTQTYNSLLTELGQIYLDRNQLKEALRLTLLAGEQHDRAGRGGTPSRLIVRENAATLLGAMGEARASLAENVVLIERVKEVESPGQEPLAYPINYARALLRMAKPKEALQVLEGVLERTRSSGNARILSYALLTQGSIFIQLGRWPEADAALTEAAALVAGGLGNKSLAAEIESQRALLDLNREDPGSAQRRIDSALEMAGYGTHKTERSLYKVLLLASRVALAEHDPQRAERFARDAVPITESQARGPDTSADTGEALMRVVEARLAMAPDQRADVRLLLERAMRCLTNALTPDHPLVVQARELFAQITTTPLPAGSPPKR